MDLIRFFACGTRSRLLVLICLTQVAVLLPARAVSAQPSRSPIEMQDALRPDFGRRDMVFFEEGLKLDDDQKLLVETLLEDYETAFGEGAKALRGELAALRPAMPDNYDQIRQEQRRLRDEIRALLEDARQRADDAVDPQERGRIMQEYQEKVNELRQKMREIMPQRTDETDDPEYEAKKTQVTGVWSAKKTILKNELIANVQAVLTDQQLELWPAMERRLRREKTMNRGQLSGESVDLFRMVRDLQLQEDFAESIAQILQSYDVRLDAALRVRNDYLNESRDQLFRAMRKREKEAGSALIARQVALHKAVREVNDEFIRLVQAALPDESARQFKDAVSIRAFPRIYRPTRGQRLFEAAVQLEELDESVHDSVMELQQNYLTSLVQTNEQLERIVRTHEPAQFVQRYQRMTAPPDGEHRERPKDQIREAYNARREFDNQYIEQLKGLLTEEQFASLPGANRAASPYDRSRSRGAGASGSGSGLIERFDADGDGRLNEDEREALREFLRNRASGGGT